MRDLVLCNGWSDNKSIKIRLGILMNIESASTFVVCGAVRECTNHRGHFHTVNYQNYVTDAGSSQDDGVPL